MDAAGGTEARSALSVAVVWRGAVPVVRLVGDLDIASAPTLRATLDELLRAPAAVVVDLTAVDFIDCSGLGSLSAAHRQVVATGGSLVCVCAPASRVASLMRLTGLLGPLAVCATVEEAIDRMTVSKR